MKQQIQVRTQYKQHFIHIQGVGKKTEEDNSWARGYGISVDLRANEQITSWLEKQTPLLNSAASPDSKLYIEVDIGEFEDGYQMHINGSQLNHPAGCRLDIIHDSPAGVAIILFAIENGLMNDHTDESRWRSEDSPYLMEGEEE
tara:strand:+ start:3395 stop:3826 length:432 start_codon:yes stop_codon:yes gene_type:complete